MTDSVFLQAPPVPESVLEPCTLLHDLAGVNDSNGAGEGCERGEVGRSMPSDSQAAAMTIADMCAGM